MTGYFFENRVDLFPAPPVRERPRARARARLVRSIEREIVAAVKVAMRSDQEINFLKRRGGRALS